MALGPNVCLAMPVPSDDTGIHRPRDGKPHARASGPQPLGIFAIPSWVPLGEFLLSTGFVLAAVTNLLTP